MPAAPSVTGSRQPAPGWGRPWRTGFTSPDTTRILPFANAVRNGVVAHHWQFGDMPPVPGVSDADIEAIICYVRELQRAAGIIAESRC